VRWVCNVDVSLHSFVESVKILNKSVSFQYANN
jgi:hypothetical protein